MGHWAGACRVVLADDVEEIRFMHRLVLEEDGRVVIVGEAADGIEAVEVVLATQPDVLLLDLALPIMDGLQVIPVVRERSPATQIVIVSGFSAARLAPLAIDLGAVAYLEKGEPLQKVVDTVLDLHQTARASG